MIEEDIKNNSTFFSLFVLKYIQFREQKAKELPSENAQEAIKIYDDLIEILTYQYTLYANRWAVYYKEWNIDKAIEDFKRVILLNPDDAMALHILSDLLQQRDWKTNY